MLPDHAAAGAEVDLVGERFGSEPGEGVVAFGGEPAQVLLWRDRRVRVRVPEGLAGATVVVITTDGRRSNPITFRVEAADGST